MSHCVIPVPQSELNEKYQHLCKENKELCMELWDQGSDLGSGGIWKAAADSVDNLRICGSLGMPWDALGCLGMPWMAWGALGCLGMPWDALGWLGMPWDALGCLGMPWVALGSLEVLCCLLLARSDFAILCRDFAGYKQGCHSYVEALKDWTGLDVVLGCMLHLLLCDPHCILASPEL